MSQKTSVEKKEPIMLLLESTEMLVIRENGIDVKATFFATN